MKFAMCNEFCENMGFADVCRLAADVGYEGVEIAPFTLAERVTDLSPARRAELKRTAAANGVQIAGLHWLLVKPEGLHLNSPDPAVRRETIDYLKAEVDFCADLGGQNVILGSPKQRNVPPGQDYGQAWARTVEALHEIGRHAQTRHVTVCIEPLAPAETNFIRSAEEARRMVDDVNTPGLQMMLDVKAMAADATGRPIPQIIRNSAGYFRHFHANDANLQGPGFGYTDFVPIVEALREVGYDGWVSVEVFDFSPGPETIARRSLEYLEQAFS
jgi:sugar phosphate isomerase/epimerase